jgi:hypothetical protein
MPAQSNPSCLDREVTPQNRQTMATRLTRKVSTLYDAIGADRPLGPERAEHRLANYGVVLTLIGSAGSTISDCRNSRALRVFARSSRTV